ncbi:hypothetical protein GMOD_00003637 [Pyrenophora seminiperda CCB06]|uniref:Uncharacterized protein n=1 Tax=Pyrenophora seminiperda CCB06 TaxID=1302712 RepID=A0A3M7MK07_9PLEO|nr:hypothetical protein GMOD_00003637 [Pyrenophora seminiperda CCB06]
MDASTRLYKRLGEIPENPNDPESLDDLIVCAFGAFERYYVCWKTKGGEYKSDAHDLPPTLKDWLYPPPDSGITRDYASLQVVFGRGQEYFASDKNGKLEHKEAAETKKVASSTPSDDNDEGLAGGSHKPDKQALRRSRTVSFLRPLSQTSLRSDGSLFASETPASSAFAGSSSKRGSSGSTSSIRASRPPSLSFTSSRSNSEVSMLGMGMGMRIVEGEAVQTARPPVWMEQAKLVSSVESLQKQEEAVAVASSERGIETGEMRSAVIPVGSPVITAMMTPETDKVGISQDVVSERSASPRQVRSSPTDTAPKSTTASPCTCGCHAPSLASTSTSPPPPTYKNSTTQTSPLPSPKTLTPTPRAPLRINTTAASSSYRSSSAGYSALSQASTSFYSDENDADYTYSYYDDDDDEEYVEPAPIGRMSAFFGKPGYQLGDSLFGGYRPIQWGEYEEQGEEEEYEYEYQDTFGEEVMR